MLIAKNNEAERSKLWRIVITVSSILIVVIAVFFLVRMFTSNPLEGNWVSEGSELALDIENNERMTVTLPDVVEEQTVEVELQYSLDRDEKTITFKEIPGALASQAESSGGQYTEENLRTALTNLTTTFSYSVDQGQLTLTEREYGEQMVFVRQQAAQAQTDTGFLFDGPGLSRGRRRGPLFILRVSGGGKPRPVLMRRATFEKQYL